MINDIDGAMGLINSVLTSMGDLGYHCKCKISNAMGGGLESLVGGGITPYPREPSTKNEGEPMHKENREYSRMPLHSKATIQIGDQSIEAESENLSLEGAFVAAVRRVELNDEVEFNFSNIPISAKAKVVRVTDKGMGLQFEKTLLG